MITAVSLRMLQTIVVALTPLSARKPARTGMVIAPKRGSSVIGPYCAMGQWLGNCSAGDAQPSWVCRAVYRSSALQRDDQVLMFGLGACTRCDSHAARCTSRCSLRVGPHRARTADHAHQRAESTPGQRPVTAHPRLPRGSHRSVDRRALGRPADVRDRIIAGQPASGVAMRLAALAFHSCRTANTQRPVASTQTHHVVSAPGIDVLVPVGTNYEEPQ